jgi:hypothetical protein
VNHLGREDYINVREGSVRIVRVIPDSLKDACEESYADKCFKHPYYQMTQKSLGEQFDQYFLILEKGGGKSYVQPLFLVRQSILGGLPALLKTGAAQGRGLWRGRVAITRRLHISCTSLFPRWLVAWVAHSSC